MGDVISRRTSFARLVFGRGVVLVLFWICLFLGGFEFPSLSRDLSPRRSDAAEAVRRNQRGTPARNQPNASPKSRLHYQTRQPPGGLAKNPRIAGTERAILGTIRELDEQLSFPFDVIISLDRCGQPDAYYDPEAHQIAVCYELIDASYSLFSRSVKQGPELDEAVQGAVSFLFLHELGHALVDACKLPITGREEDAVDQFATLFLIKNGVKGERVALNGARAFKLLANRERALFWDEHSPDRQRYYDTLCLIYGHAPRKYSYLVTNKELPEERAEICGEDYERIKTSWLQLLQPYDRLALNLH